MDACNIQADTVNSRHSSPPSPLPMADTLRPPTQRKRSNSVPIMEALGCSTPEAQLILAEGRAAVSTRKEAARRRGRRVRAEKELSKYNPRNHLHYLDPDTYPSSHKESPESIYTEDRRVSRHSRYPSNATDSSVSTVTAIHEPSGESDASSHIAARSPVGDYSANLAQFIRAQLSSIPTYNSTHLPLSPSSCPDLSYPTGGPPRSPTRPMQRATEPPKVITIPPIRPPMQSAFSEWSSTDDDETDDEVPAISSSTLDMDVSAAKASYTPSLLRYYENPQDASFLFTDTPGDSPPDTAKGFSFPISVSSRPARSPAPVPSSTPPPAMPSLPAIVGPPSSTTSSANPSLATSSAPSVSPVSTGSYFDVKLNPAIRDRVIAAVTPPAIAAHTKMMTATSPFEGKALANVHDVIVESQNRVKVDGMSFDMMSDYPSMAGAAGNRVENNIQRVQTPC